jgi:hypothetical protein
MRYLLKRAGTRWMKPEDYDAAVSIANVTLMSGSGVANGPGPDCPKTQ